MDNGTRQKTNFFNLNRATPGSEDLMWRRRKLMIIVIAAIFAVLVIVAIIGAVYNMINSASVKIMVAPTDSTITLNDKTYTNGTHKMEPGVYTVEITRSGFESYSGTIEAVSGETVNLYICLDTTSETEGWYNDDTTEDYQVCQSVTDQEIVNAEQEWLDTDPILRILPYRDYDSGYNIDYATDEELNITVTITTLTCSETRAASIYQTALDYLTSQGIDTGQYSITQKSGCE